MKKCKIKDCNKTHAALGYCQKHYCQIKKHGKIHRTMYDPNEIIIKKDYAEIVLYNKDMVQIAKAIIDIEDIDKTKKYNRQLKFMAFEKKHKVSLRNVGPNLVAYNPEIEKIKCPDKNRTIKRSTCLDYSGDNSDTCKTCGQFKKTRDLLLGEKL